MHRAGSPFVDRALGVALAILLAAPVATADEPTRSPSPLPAAPSPGGAYADASSGPWDRPPRVLSPVTAPYPAGAAGEASVTLEVVIAPDGSLASARVVRGDPPFAAAALSAASSYRYKAAEAGGKAVAARFLVMVPFRPPRPRPARGPVVKVPGAKSPTAPAGAAPVAPGAAPSPPGAAPAASAAPKATPPPLEVVVRGAGAPEGTHAGFNARELRTIPGAFGDPFRAVEVMPGVSPFATGFPYFFIRGATPSATGYFLDGIRVPLLFHVAAGPSVVNPAMIERVDLYPGGYPAEYGRFIGGAVEATTRAPGSEARAEGLLRLVDAGAYVETPLAGDRASAFAGGRYAFPGAVLALVSPDTRLGYWDYQAGGGHALTRQDRLSVLAFGSGDHLGTIERGAERTLFDASFHRVGLRLDHGRGGAAAPSARLGVTLGVDQSFLDGEGDVMDRMASVRADVELPLGDRARLRGGADMTLDRYDLKPSLSPADPEYDEPFVAAFGARTAAAFGGYLDAVLRVSPTIEVTPGVRTDVFSEDGAAKIAVDPRAALRFKLLPAVTSVTTFGVSHERPSIFVQVPGLEQGGLSRGLQEAVQVSEGLEITVPERITAQVTFFRHTFTDLTDLAATCSARAPSCSVEDRADGQAFGLEALVSRPLTDDLTGFVSYTLSRAERTAFGETFTADFDRTHVFHAALVYKVAEGWRAGARVTAYSGRPYSIVAHDDPEAPDEATLVGRRNVLRGPPFFRLDLRLERRWRVGRTGWISAVLEGMNVTLSKERVDIDCRAADLLGTTGGVRCGGDEIGPIAIPSLGVGGGF